eukprot:CAMPEP_0172545074 /NCGR_PEP_ID=MMETSP1067-20121228/15089_1 /TAXON_ID=265564 ORGANISM="Thalassiosira punctigera, Strain Tpunct2005C2" /NCGR_SAMPLE_ID=MMETSP1067 /ASSEMBLY_ACC=CAM_ASM_000444 /LENGTH=351 /DNA_ID=CAMNT_0013331745 /DNA_START=23 /DNA_END=1078 /DNA_ORIENTATION=+
MTAPVDVLSAHNHGGGGSSMTVERTDLQYRNVPASSSGPCGGYAWCDVESIQDAVCGSGLQSIMESRDDDAPSEGGSQALPAADSKSFIDDKLKAFSQELELAETVSMSNRNGGTELSQQGSHNPALVSKASSTKEGASLPAMSGSMSSINGAEKSRYETFMSSVDAASNTYGAQSIHVADLYVEMGVECVRDGPDAKSRELALLLLEEAFGIYQAKAGDSHERTVDCRIHLGKAHQSLGRHDEALDCYCMAVYMREALLGEPHPSVSEIWVLISSVHRAKGKLELALKASAKALTGYRNAYGDKHRKVIEVLTTIAGIHIEMGNNDKAVDIQKYVRIHSSKEKEDTKAEF